MPSTAPHTARGAVVGLFWNAPELARGKNLENVYERLFVNSCCLSNLKLVVCIFITKFDL